MQLSEHPYFPFLNDVRKPAQYVGGEPGERRKDWGSVACRICLGFPDLYEIGMSHLGYKILYGLVNDAPDLLAERAYAVWGDMEAKLREHGVLLRSLESARPLSEFDLVGFSLQFELTYTNVLQMLELGGIPRWSKDRDESHPLVVAGGPVATHAEPLAPFIDVFLIGDGEAKLPELMRAWAKMRDAGVPRWERLVAIAKLGGFYVPALYDTEVDERSGLQVVRPAHAEAPFPVERSIVRDLREYPFPTDGPVATTETIFDRVSVEVARGCTEGCRFCQAGMIYRPVRERDPKSIVETIDRAVRDGGYDEASLTSLSTADYSAISPLVRETMKTLDGRGVALSVSSLRAYGLGEDVLDEMKRQRAGGLTFAPEAGTQRMRDVVNKNVTEEQLLETAQRVFSRGFAKMKLYFMIGLPTEEDDDVHGIVRTGANALGVGRRVAGGKARVTVSVSTHVPKPHTPFQWCAMDAPDEILRKQAILLDDVKRTGLKLRMHGSEGSWLEGVLARGDRRLANAIASAFDRGARFDSWEDCLELERWREAFAEHAIDAGLFLGTIPTTARLPWDHIDVGLEDGFLAREYRRALKNRLSPPCGKPVGAFVHATNLRDAKSDARKLVCYDCGVACDMTRMREERIEFLTDLSALEPPAPPAPVAEDPSEDAPMEDRRPYHDVDQGPVARVRLGFTKLGRMAFGSHLDLVRLFPRLFRKLELPLYFNEGFHPMPQMTFTPALPLGVASLCEHVDLKLRARDFGADDVEPLLAGLRAIAFEGVDFFGARLLGPTDPAIQRILDQATYVAGLPIESLRADGIDPATIDVRIAERLGGPLVVRRDAESSPGFTGIARSVDVGRSLVSVTLGDPDDALGRAGLGGRFLPITFTTRFAEGVVPRPGEVIEAVLGQRPTATRFVRQSVHGVRQGRPVAPLDLEGLRAKVDPPSVEAVLVEGAP